MTGYVQQGGCGYPKHATEHSRQRLVYAEQRPAQEAGDLRGALKPNRQPTTTREAPSPELEGLPPPALSPGWCTVSANKWGPRQV